MKRSTLIIGGVVLGGLFLASEAAAWKTFDGIARQWRATVNGAAKAYGISRHVLAALLYKESTYNPGQIGKAGEKGMGQMLPGAWADVQRAYPEFADLSYDAAMVDPTTQIRSAAAYYALKKRDMGNAYDALRAYNAGTHGAKDHPGVAVDYALNILRLAAVDWLLAELNV